MEIVISVWRRTQWRFTPYQRRTGADGHREKTENDNPCGLGPIPTSDRVARRRLPLSCCISDRDRSVVPYAGRASLAGCPARGGRPTSPRTSAGDIVAGADGGCRHLGNRSLLAWTEGAREIRESRRGDRGCEGAPHLGSLLSNAPRGRTSTLGLKPSLRWPCVAG